MQYTSGEVVLELSMSKEAGYQTGCILLQKGYRSSYKIASAYVEKLSSGPVIKAEDGEELKKVFHCPYRV